MDENSVTNLYAKVDANIKLDIITIVVIIGLSNALINLFKNIFSFLIDNNINGNKTVKKEKHIFNIIFLSKDSKLIIPVGTNTIENNISNNNVKK